MQRVGVVDTQTQSTCMHFDCIEALVWIGTENGRVLSMQPPSLSLHTCGFVAESGVRAIESVDKGLVVLSDGEISLRDRDSLRSRWLLRASENSSIGLFQCMALIDSDLVVSTSFGALLLVGLRSGIILKTLAQPDGSSAPYVIMRPLSSSSNTSSKLLLCATAAGAVHVRDMKLPAARVISRFDSHSGMLSDLDLSPCPSLHAKGPSILLATTGFTMQRPYMLPDACVKLWDLSTPSNPKFLHQVDMPALVPVPDSENLQQQPAMPTFVRFGLVDGTEEPSPSMIGIQDSGHVVSWDPLNSRVHEAELHDTQLDGYMTSMEYSTTGDYLAVASSSGTVSLYSTKSAEIARVNTYERESTVPDLTPKLIPVRDQDPLSLVGMPYYNEQLLSASWPTSLTHDASRPLTRIPKEVLAQAKMSDFVGYAQNPGLSFRRNQTVQSIWAQSQARAALESGFPKFRSEQEREGLGKSGRRSGYGVRDSPILDAAYPSSATTSPIPKPYRRVQIKYSKFGIEDFDFAFFNKSSPNHSGLETHISNSYTNALLQLFYYTPPLRRVAASHISNLKCSKPKSCLLCELGFLFAMLKDAKGANCQAGNFLNVFAGLKDAGALGLFDEDSVKGVGAVKQPVKDVGVMIHGFHRFILEVISGESGVGVSGLCTENREESEALETVMKQVMGLPMRGVNSCNGCGKKDLKDTIAFVIDVGLKFSSAEVIPSFGQLLEISFLKETSFRAPCAGCNKQQTISHTKTVRRLPNLLSINFSLNAGDLVETWMEGGSGSWIPQRIALVLKGAQVSVFDLEKDGFNIDEYEEEQVAIYDLKGVVSEIKTGDTASRSHLVAHIYVDDESGWLLFNDFLVEPISANEATQFTKWKTPTVMQYIRVDLNDMIDYSKLDSAVPLDSLLTETAVLNERQDLAIMSVPLAESELPLISGYLVAIDAEFVSLQKEELEIRSDGSRSTILPSKLGLARVSVLRGKDGPMEGVPFMDDYIAIQDPIVDYLTEYSGIYAGDLDPVTSTHPLVHLKVAYQKLRHLVDSGCIFVGHGLKKDFRTINIIVPPEQIIDTVDIFFIKERQRKLSLRFLAWSLLRSDIQQDTHDSIEDARAALLLYKKYLALTKEGTFEQVLDAIYEEGRKYNFKPPQK
ncbi:ubiquitin carboxyl-terminal hydrolase-domain-containing protein [Chytriomyces cf. hyalinus JEL632]|nr:ubiquitin carboxyl-terminal hydrolase-domain-containing protein [Chytriomyces cf. hyalinus JEL632]